MSKRSLKPNSDNERVKRRYAEFLKEAKRLSEATVDKRLAAIDQFEVDTGRRDFKAFHIDQAIRFKAGLRDRISPATGKPLASSTVDHTLQAMRGDILSMERVDQAARASNHPDRRATLSRRSRRDRARQSYLATTTTSSA